MIAVRACKNAYGSRRWFATELPPTASDPFNAVWLPSGETVIHTQAGPVHTDGHVRFFELKRDLLAAVGRSTVFEIRRKE